MLHSPPPPAASPTVAAGLALRPVPGQRAFSARRKRAEPAPDDVKLLALGEQLDTTYAAEMALYALPRLPAADVLEQAFRKTAHVTALIEASTATTAAGLAVKVRAISRMPGFDPALDGDLDESASREFRLVVTSLVRDVLEMSRTVAPAVTKAA